MALQESRALMKWPVVQRSALCWLECLKSSCIVPNYLFPQHGPPLGFLLLQLQHWNENTQEVPSQYRH